MCLPCLDIEIPGLTDQFKRLFMLCYQWKTPNYLLPKVSLMWLFWTFQKVIKWRYFDENLANHFFPLFRCYLPSRLFYHFLISPLHHQFLYHSFINSLLFHSPPYSKSIALPKFSKLSLQYDLWLESDISCVTVPPFSLLRLPNFCFCCFRMSQWYNLLNFGDILGFL